MENALTRKAFARKTNALKYSLATGAAALMNTAVAFAEESGEAAASIQSALNSVFGIATSISEATTNGFLGIILPIGIAVGLYFVVRMLLASDPKDVAAFRKRAIATGILVAIGFAIPGLMAIAKQIGELVNNQL